MKYILLVCFVVGSKKGGAGEEESGSLFVLVKNGKEARMKDEEKMKTLKWNFSQPRREHVEQLKDQMQPCVSATILTQLFHDDFKKHITALDTLTKVIDIPELSVRPPLYLCVWSY